MDPEIRLLGVAALGQTKNDEAVPILARLAKSDINVSVRVRAVSALGSIGTPVSKAALRDILDKKDIGVRP